MRWFWAQRGYHREGRAWYATFLARADGRTAPRAWALREAGYLALRQGDYSASMPMLEEGLALCRELGDRTGVTAALVALGEVLYAQSDFRRGKRVAEEAVTLAGEIGDWHWLHDALCRLGDITYHLGEYPRALACYEETLSISQQHSYPHGIASGLRGLGQVATIQSEYQRGRALLGQSLGHFLELKDRRCAARCLQALACVASGLGQPEPVAQLLGAAEALRQAVGLEELPATAADHQARAAARAALGEAAFAARWAEGRSMTFAEAVDYARSAEVVAAATTAPETRAIAGQASLLTPRERQVAVLIAQGLTNRQIASELIVAESTAERHVANIMNKLGVNARSQVAAWAVEYRLARAQATN
jgi:non-specific serine/threonine protein kinase